VATVHASNAVGTINPVRQIAEMAHAAKALYVVDAVQSAPHIPIDVQAIGCDFLLCSAYKFFGPHIGVMWGRYELLADLPVYKVRPSKDKPPYRWETGTPSFETIAGVGAAVGYLASIGRVHGADYASQFPGFSGSRLTIKTAMAAVGAHEREQVFESPELPMRPVMLSVFPQLFLPKMVTRRRLLLNISLNNTSMSGMVITTLWKL
jgi:selenocysteine lyase/cysteine desulfurase